jgi:surface antigen
MKLWKLALVASLVLPLAACNSGRYYGYRDYGPKETVGTLTGAALGGLAGAQFGHGSGRLAATAAGVFLGGLIGNQIGQSLDRQDLAMARESERDALEYYPDGQASRWDNPNNGNYGYTTPTRTYEPEPETYCREYQTTIVVNGRAQTGYGTACRQPDGSWQIVG